jgi:hypothetical protein
VKKFVINFALTSALIFGSVSFGFAYENTDKAGPASAKAAHHELAIPTVQKIKSFSKSKAE